jgi:hypothetical protein
MSSEREARAPRAIFHTLAMIAAFTLSACSSPQNAGGTLRIGNQGELAGIRYWFEARFELTGREALALDVGYTNSGLEQALEPGAYSLEIQPDFQVLRDAALAEVPIEAALASPRVQSLQLVSGATTLVSYRLAVDAGLVSFASN